MTSTRSTRFFGVCHFWPKLFGESRVFMSSCKEGREMPLRAQKTNYTYLNSYSAALYGSISLGNDKNQKSLKLTPFHSFSCL